MKPWAGYCFLPLCVCVQNNLKIHVQIFTKLGGNITLEHISRCFTFGPDRSRSIRDGQKNKLSRYNYWPLITCAIHPDAVFCILIIMTLVLQLVSLLFCWSGVREDFEPNINCSNHILIMCHTLTVIIYSSVFFWNLPGKIVENYLTKGKNIKLHVYFHACSFVFIWHVFQKCRFLSRTYLTCSVCFCQP